MKHKKQEDFSTFLDYYKFVNDYNNKFKDIQVKEEFKQGLQMYKDFGFTVLLTDKTFTLWQNDKRLYGFSSHVFLRVKTVTKQIETIFTDRGIKKGKELKIQSIKKVLGL